MYNMDLTKNKDDFGPTNVKWDFLSILFYK